MVRVFFGVVGNLMFDDTGVDAVATGFDAFETDRLMSHRP